jgi:hypothetical protein
MNQRLLLLKSALVANGTTALFSTESLGKNCAVLLEKRCGGADTAVTIQCFLKQLLHMEIITRMDYLKLETRTDINEKQTCHYTVEIVGYMEIFFEDLSLIRRGLKLLRSMPQQSIASKFSSHVCVSILENLETQQPSQLDSDTTVFCAVRRLCFEILSALEFKNIKEWSQWSKRLLGVIGLNIFEKNLGCVQALSLLLKRFVDYDQTQANLDSTFAISKTRPVAMKVKDAINKARSSIIELRDAIAQKEALVQQAVSDLEDALTLLLSRTEILENMKLEILDLCRDYRYLHADAVGISDDELALLNPNFRQLIDWQHEIDRRVLETAEYTRETNHELERFIEPESDD